MRLTWFEPLGVGGRSLVIAAWLLISVSRSRARHSRLAARVPFPWCLHRSFADIEGAQAGRRLLPSAALVTRRLIERLVCCAPSLDAGIPYFGIASGHQLFGPAPSAIAPTSWTTVTVASTSR